MKTLGKASKKSAKRKKSTELIVPKKTRNNRYIFGGTLFIHSDTVDVVSNSSVTTDALSIDDSGRVFGRSNLTLVVNDGELEQVVGLSPKQTELIMRIILQVLEYGGQKR